MKYLPIAVVVAGAAAGLWWARRDRGAGPATPAATAAPTPPSTPSTPPSSVRPGPARPVVVRPPAPAALPEATPPAPGPGATAVGFEAEARDPAWAVEQERELGLRLEAVIDRLGERGAGVELTGVECRTSQCRFAVAATATGGLSALYGALETPEGLYGWADAVVLGGVDTEPRTGGLTTAITVVFER